MQSVFFVMAIMGCGDGNAGCVPARVDQARYATMAECRSQLAAGLARNSDLSFPVITADCRRNSPVTMAGTNRTSSRG